MTNAVENAKRVFEIEQAALIEVASKLDDDFKNSVKSILNMKGKLIVIGMGKSGHIGQKIAATLASTGTPSFFVHPAEAFHGDLGMIGKEDRVLLISYSGETDEILRIIPYLKWNGNQILAMSGNAHSTLAKESNFNLDIGVSLEACPLELAPTSSTTATLAMGDALAVALMEARDFQPEDFARFHPGGSLGRRLLHKVKDYMRSENLPYLSESATGHDLVLKLSEGRLGLVLVTDNSGKFLGIITDGDLRRAMNEVENLRDLSVKALCNHQPMMVPKDTPIHEAEQIMLEKKILSVLVEDNGEVCGVCQLYSIYGNQ
ncbi:MAG: KpsF/GutQ family sugar-phosphate isomerase [Bacteroidetes bacterium]|nr:KpsF/GutQ family sugar-phosphate isomerase [Bacteroidota bacterium]